MKWDDMEYTGHRTFFYVFVVVPEVLFMLRSHNVSQQVRWRNGRFAKLGLLSMLEDIVTSFCRDRSANARGGVHRVSSCSVTLLKLCARRRRRSRRQLERHSRIP